MGMLLTSLIDLYIYFVHVLCGLIDFLLAHEHEKCLGTAQPTFECKDVFHYSVIVGSGVY